MRWQPKFAFSVLTGLGALAVASGITEVKHWGESLLFGLVTLALMLTSANLAQSAWNDYQQSRDDDGC